jgi:hypothetical protein
MNYRRLLLTSVGVAIAVPVLAQQEPAATDLAAQVRLQGHRCEGSVSAQRDSAQSRPDEAVWILTCANATYRVRLVPNMAAHIERLQ